MAQCCYKTYEDDSQNSLKIDAVSTSQLLSGYTKKTINQYHNVTRDITHDPMIVPL